MLFRSIITHKLVNAENIYACFDALTKTSLQEKKNLGSGRTNAINPPHTNSGSNSTETEKTWATECVRPIMSALGYAVYTEKKACPVLASRTH